MGIQFHETVRGQRFFDIQLPKLTKAIERLAEAKEKENTKIAPAAKTTNAVYVCYEENSHELAVDNGTIHEMVVATKFEEVAQWVNARLSEASVNSYSVAFKEDEADFCKNLVMGRSARLPLFYEGNLGSSLYYALVVEPCTLPTDNTEANVTSDEDPALYKIVLSSYDFDKSESYKDEVKGVFTSKMNAEIVMLDCVFDELQSLNGILENDAFPERRFIATREDEEHDVVINAWDGPDYRPVTCYDIVKVDKEKDH